MFLCACVRERSDESASLGGERVLLVVARGVQAPDLSLGTLLGQRVKHGEYRGGADSGTDQQYGRIRPVEEECAARRRHVDPVADVEPLVQIAAGAATALVLDRMR